MVLTALFFALPYRWRATVGADTRVLPAMIVCAVGSVACSLPLRRPRLAMLLLVAAVAVRGGSVAHAWHAADDQLHGMLGSIECLPPETRLLPIPLVAGPAKERPQRHFPAHAVVLRRAFVPTLFSAPDQQPLRLTMAHPEPWSVDEGILRVEEEVAREAYDFVWICNPDRLETRLPGAWERIYARDDIEVWRIARP
jgi:hypothetical protein